MPPMSTYFMALILGIGEAGAGSGEKSVLQIIEEDALRHKKLLIAAGAVLFLILIIFFYRDIKAFFSIVALIAIGVLSRLWQRFIPLSIGANLIMLVTVVAGVMYGPLAGISVGVLSLFISAILVLDELATMLPPFFAIALAGYIAGYLPAADISFGGMALTILYDVIISVSYFFLGVAGIRTALFVATHIVFNYFVFYNVAPALINILA